MQLNKCAKFEIQILKHRTPHNGNLFMCILFPIFFPPNIPYTLGNDKCEFMHQHGKHFSARNTNRCTNTLRPNAKRLANTLFKIFRYRGIATEHLLKLFLSQFSIWQCLNKIEDRIFMKVSLTNAPRAKQKQRTELNVAHFAGKLPERF